MQHIKNQPNEATDSGRDKEPTTPGSEYSGFLILQMREGDLLEIGDSVICINELLSNKVKLAVKAKKSTKIKRTPAARSDAK